MVLNLDRVLKRQGMIFKIARMNCKLFRKERQMIVRNAN